MTQSYTGNPASSTKDEVRFLTGDTHAGTMLLEDEEITWMITREGSVDNALTEIIRAMLAKCAHDTLVSADGITRDLSGRRAMLEKLLRTIDERSSMRNVAPFVGGTSIAERDTRQQDGDLIQPAFRRGQFDDPNRHPTEDDEQWP